ncbi:MAG: helicase-related protein [Candidatus Nitrosocosmicus sp.]
MDKKYFNHPLLKERSLLYRDYQNSILQKSLYKNSLIVVPTSLGKTVIALLTGIDILYNWRSSKILILAPTRPLVHQHLELFKRFTILENICFGLTGKISPDIRKSIWNSRSIRVYFATPEIVRNDLESNVLKRDAFSLIVFDEAHRAVKDYSYTSIAKKFYNNTDKSNVPMVLALSASPGSNKEKIQQICSNLFIEQTIVKSEKDEDVLPYVFNIEVKHKRFDLDNLHIQISENLKYLIHNKIEWLIDNNFIKKKKVENVYKKDLLELGKHLKDQITKSDNKNFFLYAALKYQSMSLILLYCRDLIESQGGFSLKKFFNKFQENNLSKTYQELLSEPLIQKVIELLNDDKILNYPKIPNLIIIVKEFLLSSNENINLDSETASLDIKTGDWVGKQNNRYNYDFNDSGSIKRKILIFSQYRDTLDVITSILNKHHIPCKGFYGQSNKKDKKGLDQEKQISIIEEFKTGMFPVLVATSVAEEGLDIPNVDLVIFYEPVPSEIRFIQRKGRTGRFSDGKVIVLVANNSIDSKYLEIVQKKILKMKNSLKDTNLTLSRYEKRSFDIPDIMKLTEIKELENVSAFSKRTEKEIKESFNPIADSIYSNSSKRIRHLVKKISYKKKYTNDQSYYSTNDLEHLYDISLSLDNRRSIEKAQRQIYDLISKSGKEGLELDYLKETIKLDSATIEKAIKNLEKLKRIVWLNRKTISLIDSIKFIPGRKYSIFIEKILFGKAIVIINEKWYASLDYFDYVGPKSLLKKGNTFNIIGDTYRRNGTLHLIVKKTM